MIFRFVGTAFLILAIVGLLLKSSGSTPVQVAGWALLVVGAVGELFATIIYVISPKDD